MSKSDNQTTLSHWALHMSTVKIKMTLKFLSFGWLSWKLCICLLIPLGTWGQFCCLLNASCSDIAIFSYLFFVSFCRRFKPRRAAPTLNLSSIQSKSSFRKITLFYLAKSATQPQPFYVWSVVWWHKELLSSSTKSCFISTWSLPFKKKLPQTVQKEEKDIDTTWINDLRNLWGNWVYRSYWDRKRNNLDARCMYNVDARKICIYHE